MNNQTKRVLHILSQRPQRTGSGITLEELVNHGTKNNWEQRIIVGVPANEPLPSVGTLKANQIHTVKFEISPLNFPVPGMSDVMPYKSSKWSKLAKDQLETYKDVWSETITKVVNDFKPSIIHTNHIWIVSSLLKKLFPLIPVVAHCHATGLRQMALCPHLKDEVIKGCSKIDSFAVLHNEHKTELIRLCNVEPSKVHVVGAGFNPEIFKPLSTNRSFGNSNPSGKLHIAYAGKYSKSKGLESLLDAIELLNDKTKVILHVGGSGSGSEADQLKKRMLSLADKGQIILYGQVDQKGLAEIFNKCSIVALPSFYEGVPLVLVEGLSCGCQIVCTKLVGVENELLPYLKKYITMIELPAMKTIDSPQLNELPVFANRIKEAIVFASKKPPLFNKNNKTPTLEKDLDVAIERFTWEGVFKRVEKIWQEQIKC